MYVGRSQTKSSAPVEQNFETTPLDSWYRSRRLTLQHCTRATLGCCTRGGFPCHAHSWRDPFLVAKLSFRIQTNRGGAT